jgi:hypothetical protein
MAGTSPAMTSAGLVPAIFLVVKTWRVGIRRRRVEIVMDTVITVFGALLMLVPMLFLGGLLIVLVLVAIGRLMVGAPDQTTPRFASAFRSAGFGERSVKILGMASQWMIAASLCAIVVAGYYGVERLACGPTKAGPLYYCFFDVIDHRDYRR